MSDPNFGVVKKPFEIQGFQDFGFIRPDKPRPDGRDILFHRSYVCVVSENPPGEVVFGIEAALKRDPRRGDRIVYFSGEHKKGPAASQWNYAEEWEKAEAVIAERPWPTCTLCRVVRQEVRPQPGLTVLWEGYHPLLIEMVHKGDAPFPQDQWEWYTTVWCEEFRVGGWQRMLDTSSGHPVVISEDKRQLLQRFELARLICQGEQMRAQMKAGHYSSTCVIFGDEKAGYSVDEIGCALLARFKNPRVVLGLFSRRSRELPESNPARIRDDFICAELLGLPFELIDACTWQMFVRTEYNPQRLARWLRTSLAGENRYKSALDEYRQLAEPVVVA